MCMATKVISNVIPLLKLGQYIIDERSLLDYRECFLLGNANFCLRGVSYFYLF
jgi:hypothetical protein